MLLHSKTGVSTMLGTKMSTMCGTSTINDTRTTPKIIDFNLSINSPVDIDDTNATIKATFMPPIIFTLFHIYEAGS